MGKNRNLRACVPNSLLCYLDDSKGVSKKKKTTTTSNIKANCNERKLVLTER